MYHSLDEVILKLPPETLVYSGHDYGGVPFSSLGEEKASNPYLQARSLGEFLSTFS
jgi:glyoxylase-like metal-dependent hydrolase (beta-lactamase superfamily II)